MLECLCSDIAKWFFSIALEPDEQGRLDKYLCEKCLRKEINELAKEDSKLPKFLEIRQI